MIIVEGMDNSGKTTLIEKLADDLKLVKVNNRKRPESSNDIWMWVSASVEMARHHPTILDRWAPISEPIYGPICRDTRLFSSHDQALTMAYLETFIKRPIIIYCRPSESKIRSWGDRAQMDGVIKNSERLLVAYDHSMKSLAAEFQKCYWINYNYETDDYPLLCSQVKANMLFNQPQGERV